MDVGRARERGRFAYGVNTRGFFDVPMSGRRPILSRTVCGKRADDLTIASRATRLYVMLAVFNQSRLQLPSWLECRLWRMLPLVSGVAVLRRPAITVPRHIPAARHPWSPTYSADPHTRALQELADEYRSGW